MAVTGPSSKMKRRIAVCIALLAVAGSLGLIVRLFTLQLVDASGYREMAARQQLREVEISPERGTIYDRNMKVLAKSATVWTIVLSPADIRESKDSDGNVVRTEDELRNLVADGLSAILEVDRDLIIEKSHRKTYYEIVKSKVDRSVMEEVLKFTQDNKISCVFWEQDNKRYYPYGSLASTVLGFTNYDNEGAYGLEAKYDSVLSGTPGRVVSAKNAWGTNMDFKYDQMYDAKPGNSIVLTIDETIQHFVEKNLETAMKEHGVRNRAACIVMDMRTGEILAMATKNDFDPNDPYKLTDPAAEQALADAKARGVSDEEYSTLRTNLWYDQWRNKCISDPYEPGSVFKLITAAAVYEEKAVNPNAFGFNCSGVINVAGTKMHCWKLIGHGYEDFDHVIINSCNPGTVTLGLALGGEKFYDYYEAFGLTEKTGIDLPGEAGNTGLFYSKEKLMERSPSVELASNSFGQTHKETPIQLITAVTAALNGGYLMQPHVVKQVLDADGNIVENIEPVVKRQVVSKETSARIASIAEQVVTVGSGKNAYLAGYRVGGKTGTSQKIDARKEGEAEKYICSFYGFAPADDPQVAVLLMLDEPYVANPYGSVIAAPVVGAILSETLPYLGVEPRYNDTELQNVDIQVPNVIGKVTLDAQGALRPLGLDSEIIGNGTKVIKQTPRALTNVPKGTKVLLYTDAADLGSLVTVPNVVGMTAQQANVALTNAGLNVRITGAVTTGATTVAKQSEPEGTQVEQGAVITIQMITRDTSD